MEGNHRLIKAVLCLLALLAVFYPVYYSVKDLPWADFTGKEFLVGIFPALGIAAFAIMWLHIVGGPFRSLLGKYFDFEEFVRRTVPLVLLLIILHPLLLFIVLGWNNLSLIFSPQAGKWIWFGIIGWLMLIIYDIGKAFRTRQFFQKYWPVIDLVSTLGFFVIFFHSIGIGDDLQSGVLRYIWIFYAVTALLSTLHKFMTGGFSSPSSQVPPSAP